MPKAKRPATRRSTRQVTLATQNAGTVSKDHNSSTNGRKGARAMATISSTSVPESTNFPEAISLDSLTEAITSGQGEISDNPHVSSVATLQTLQTSIKDLHKATSALTEHLRSTQQRERIAIDIPTANPTRKSSTAGITQATNLPMQASSNDVYQPDNTCPETTIITNVDTRPPSQVTHNTPFNSDQQVGYTLNTAYGNLQSTSNGIPSDSVQRVDIVSPQLKRDILSGKDINLTSLLIPGFKSDQNVERHMVVGDEVIPLKPLSDPRLQKPLTIQEFIRAFSIYKNVMCQTFPQRLQELDTYMSDIVEMAARFQGFAFYEYHKMFSARAATLLQNYNIKVDWSKRDNNLFCTIFAGQRSNTCGVCNSTIHATGFCPLIMRPQSNTKNAPRPQSRPVETHDRRGRQRVFYKSKEICNNFNSSDNCRRFGCDKLHICVSCKSADHSVTEHKCQQSSTGSSPQA